MVAREKDGNSGYLVFAPFVTRGAYRPGSNRKTEVSIIVCLGWVPRNHKDRIISDRDKFTEEEVDQEESEDGEESLIKVSGILRPTETRDILKGAVNWEGSQYYKFIDLFLMARFFRIYNLESASKVYLQRVVETYSSILPLGKRRWTVCPFPTRSTRSLSCTKMRGRSPPTILSLQLGVLWVPLAWGSFCDSYESRRPADPI